MTSPPLSQEQPDGSRLYRHPLTGELAPSVTTIISQINKPRLVGWSARLAAEYAISEWDSLGELSPYGRKEAIRYAHERERDKASDLGTQVHLAIEHFVNGEPFEHSKEVSPFMTSFTRFLMEKRPEFLRAETTVWNRTYGYAGTADIIAVIDGKTYLADWKSGRSLHSEVGLQLSALAHGEFIITPEGQELEMPHIDAVAAIHIRPRSWRFAPVNCFEENFSAFLAARELYYWSTEVSPRVLGEAA